MDVGVEAVDVTDVSVLVVPFDVLEGNDGVDVTDVTCWCRRTWRTVDVLEFPDGGVVVVVVVPVGVVVVVVVPVRVDVVTDVVVDDDVADVVVVVVDWVVVVVDVADDAAAKVVTGWHVRVEEHSCLRPTSPRSRAIRRWATPLGDAAGAMLSRCT